MGKKQALRSGDVFAFPLDGKLAGVGQIIDDGVQLYITILAKPMPLPVELENVDVEDILLCGRTSDAQFFQGIWTVIGSMPLPQRVPRPCAKVSVEGEKWIASFSGKIVRRATDEEWETLDFQTSRSPILYEEAFKASCGVGNPGPSDHKMSVEYLQTQEAVCGARS